MLNHLGGRIEDRGRGTHGSDIVFHDMIVIDWKAHALMLATMVEAVNVACDGLSKSDFVGYRVDAQLCRPCNAVCSGTNMG